jgi:signal peptidase I
MAKNKHSAKNKAHRTPAPQAPASAPQGNGMYALRETLESIVIAFVLAFLFRTFEAEAFVIPTGSMSPALQGQHKDVDCSECGYRFRTTASSEASDGRLQAIAKRRSQQEVDGYQVVAGMCPMCRQTMAMRSDLPTQLPESLRQQAVTTERSYPGDRILVNKYAYNDRQPERWDVVVFKFPGNGEMNYIKRLVGLPNETLRVYQGDLFVRDDTTDGDFEIARKSADQLPHLLQPVHDTDYDAAALFSAGWPLRWESQSAWQIETEPNAQTVKQTYRVDAPAQAPAWLRYRHYVPGEEDWALARSHAANQSSPDQEQWLASIRPELITDFNPYNAHVLRSQLVRGPLAMEPDQLGAEWVSDLAVRCEVEVEQASGLLLLDLVEAGRHFTCEIDLGSGQATFRISGADSFQATAATPVQQTGSYKILFANVDDQLHLWVNDKPIQVEGTSYNETVIGPRKKLLPRTDPSDPGDLAPVGIGAQDTQLVVTRLEVLRDIYYIAANQYDPQLPRRWSRQPYFVDYLAPRSSKKLSDGSALQPLGNLRDLFRDPETWGRFATRRKREFTLGEEQLFVLGDNSPASQDCRLWDQQNGHNGAKPGGPYLDRRLLIGKAICVFWPHSWGGIPGLDPLPGFPNFGDMRLVR